MDTMSESKEYWEGYYSSHRDPAGESPFARFVSGFLKPGDHLYELGCGNGRDSVFFAERGVNVLAFDQCDTEIAYLNGEKANDHLAFEAGDFTALGDRDPVECIYSRFTLHSVALEEEKKTLKWSFDTLKEGGMMFIEIRSVLDDLCGQGEQVGENEYVTTHYRRFVTFEGFVQRVEEAGFSILYKQEAKGLAPYGDDDPVVIRIVGQRKR